MFRILLVDDSRQSRYYIQGLIAEESEYEIIASIESAANAELYCVKHSVDMILMDVCTADNASGLMAAKQLKKKYPGIQIIIITSLPEYSFMKKAMEAGCEGFWYKEYGDAELLDVMQRVRSGERVYPERAPVVPIGDAYSPDFSERELEIIRLLSEGYSRQEIADRLFISPRTVRFHIDSMKEKTGYEDTMQLVSEMLLRKLVAEGL